MAELANVTDGRGLGAARPNVLGWPRSQALVLVGIAAVMGLWTALAQSWWGAAGGLVAVAIIASRPWPRVVRLVAFGLLPNNLTWTWFLATRGYADAAPWTDTVRLYARRVEVWLLAGEMPTTRLQRALFDPPS